ncbi:hypothetical protein Sjap_007558 [Stephania japonica]|uniref:Uncharacterized protein n=1 Tax=Stephania japonica TaxID=461633 RepID=A0AAP0JN83_9MAGN
MKLRWGSILTEVSDGATSHVARISPLPSPTSTSIRHSHLTSAAPTSATPLAIIAIDHLRQAPPHFAAIRRPQPPPLPTHRRHHHLCPNPPPPTEDDNTLLGFCRLELELELVLVVSLVPSTPRLAWNLL